MRIFVFILLFCTALIFSMVIPSLFGIKEQFPFLAASIALILYFGITEYGIGSAAMMSIFGELFSGMHIGIISLPLLVSIIGLHLLEKVVNIKALASREYWTMGNFFVVIMIGVLMFVSTLIISTVISDLYGSFASWRTLMTLLVRWPVYVYNAILLCSMLVILRLFLREKTPSYL
jgi:hypothetical protein